ncbi:hypothetical protein [Thermotoga caldifontis]|uniref:hypothetical protein n=1 Tax=Thermotoga caldifontis TaxID=1508419 RepID=UPI00059783E3|nr:hypothetical protein [Thermotoga caldifontis]
MYKKLLVALFLILAITFLASQFTRSINETIEVLPDGSAIITRTEFVPQSDLYKVYVKHYDNIRQNKAAFENFVLELSKHYYFLYGTTPTFSLNDVSVTEDSKGITMTIKMKVPGIVRYVDGAFQIIRKGFENEKMAEKLMPKYFENEIDGKFFESMFLQSEKNTLVTERKVEIILPKGSEFKLANTFFTKGEPRSWYVDMGGGTTYKAQLESTERGVVLKETIVTNGGAPKNLLDKESSIKVLDSLRDYTAFAIHFTNKEMVPEKLSKPVPHKIADDFSDTWSFSVSSGELFSCTFTYQTLSVTPKITVTLKFSATLTWNHHWVKTGWFSWSYRLDKFETLISLSPSITPSLEVSSGGSIEKSWTKDDLFKRTSTVTFWVSCVPVVLQLVAELDAEATAKIYGSIGFKIWTTYTLNTSVRVTYQNGWSKNVSYSANYSGVHFEANANIGAEATGKLPFTLAAYVYYVAGPFLRLTPWINGQTSASVGTQNQVGYSVTGGLTASGGVQMSGWLKNLCDNIPSVEYTFWEKSWTLASGTYRF